MAKARTGAERYIAEQKRDPSSATPTRTPPVEPVRSRRWSVLERGPRAAGLTRPSSPTRRHGIRSGPRLFTAEGPNPTAAALIALADVLDVELVANRPSERGIATDLAVPVADR